MGLQKYGNNFIFANLFCGNVWDYFRNTKKTARTSRKKATKWFH